MNLVPITKENWQDAAGLSVREDQKGFVADNLWSIAETQFYPWAIRLAIVDEETMVGFLVYGRDPEDGSYWLYRFMIDQRFQGKGLGRGGLLALLDRLRREPNCPNLTVGFQPHNVAAERLYLSVGFTAAGVAPWGEKTARYVFDDLK